jgi:GNAT superfamily N-acetyltransferase
MSVGGARLSEVDYTADLAWLTPERLRGGFFQDWPAPWSPERHLAHLRGAEAVELAVDPATGDVVGFVSAIGDSGNVAFISLLEVLPAWRGRGIGHELMRRMLGRLRDRYSIDLGCDEGLVPFYEGLGLTPSRSMVWRNRPNTM